MSPGDRIVAIAQGEDLFVDSRDMKLDKIAEIIRGKKGTVVRLQVLLLRQKSPSARSQKTDNMKQKQRLKHDP